MIVPDTSAWVEFFRGTEHPARFELKRLIEMDGDIAVTEVVVMEVLSGARRPSQVEEFRSHLLAYPLLHLEGLLDFEEAARIYRRCRAGGETIRTINDCLITVPAIRAGAQVLHVNRDFEAIARHSDLELYSLGG